MNGRKSETSESPEKQPERGVPRTLEEEIEAYEELSEKICAASGLE